MAEIPSPLAEPPYKEAITMAETTYPMVKIENEIPKSNGTDPMLAAMMGNQGGFGGGMGGMSMLLPWLFLFARGGLFGQNGEAGAINARDIAKDTYETAIDQMNASNAGFNSVNGNISNLGLSQCNSFANVNNNVAQYAFGLERAMCSGFNQTQMQGYQNFAALSQQLASCCCTTQLNIERSQNALQQQIAEVNYESANRTAAIIASQVQGTQSILDKLCDDKISDLQNQLNQCAIAQNNLQQTNAILGALTNQAATDTAAILSAIQSVCGSSK
jgi:hypothetical protein